jgi:hypothetical protein
MLLSISKFEKSFIFETCYKIIRSNNKNKIRTSVHSIPIYPKKQRKLSLYNIDSISFIIVGFLEIYIIYNIIFQFKNCFYSTFRFIQFSKVRNERI